MKRTAAIVAIAVLFVGSVPALARPCAPRTRCAALAAPPCCCDGAVARQQTDCRCYHGPVQPAPAGTTPQTSGPERPTDSAISPLPANHLCSPGSFARTEPSAHAPGRLAALRGTRLLC